VSERSFDVARFAELRRARGCAWGEPLTHYREIGSTNDEALKAARAGAPAGSVFVADHQSSGRGRTGKSWLSKAGAGLLFSVLIRPRTSADRLSSLTLAVGLGARAALEKASAGDFAVKWPNDVLERGRKVAGVLCEGQLSGREVEAIVIGVGINIGRQELPPDLAGTATSLEDLVLAGHVVPDREELLVEALAAIETRAARHLEHGFAALLDEFTEHDALAGRRIAVSGASEVRGIARGVDREGQLLVEDEGLVIALRSGTVRIIG
jgi:BirA family transcriptional regulator, biotin operon repressor / biotin---[acetyl-CoA-carboxylase] ligase